MNKILLIDVDSKMPNLALMKLSAHHKAKGDKVGFNVGNPDIVYISCIFSRNRNQTLGIETLYPKSKVLVGGCGINYNVELPPKIEHIPPDYSLYGVDYSMGYTSRGCLRRCEFCLIPQKEGMIRDHAPITEFLSKDHENLILMDNNFLASPKWCENLEYIIEHNLNVNFTQGLDIRLITKENTAMLSKINYCTRSFKSHLLHFAYDDPMLKESVNRGIRILKDAGIPPRNLMFYLLCGFNTSHDEDMARYLHLYGLGCDSYVMRYNNRRDNKRLNKFARWVNYLRGLRTCGFDQYKVGV